VADGAWTISVRSIDQVPAWDGGSILGVGDSLLRFEPPTEGLLVLGITHQASAGGNFAIIAYGTSGQDVLVNELGDYAGEIRLPPETILLEIIADGAWNLFPS
jgi:hypothetical protein